MVKTHVNVQRINSGQKQGRFEADQDIGPVLNIGIATVIDVLGIDVQVPSLSSPGYPVWILTSRGRERFVNEIHRHNSDIVNYNSSLRTKGENPH